MTSGRANLYTTAPLVLTSFGVTSGRANLYTTAPLVLTRSGVTSGRANLYTTAPLVLTSSGVTSGHANLYTTAPLVLTSSGNIPDRKQACLTLWQAERHFCHLRFTGAATILSFFRSILLAWILLAKLSVNVQ